MVGDGRWPFATPRRCNVLVSTFVSVAVFVSTFVSVAVLVSTFVSVAVLFTTRIRT